MRASIKSSSGPNQYIFVLLFSIQLQERVNNWIASIFCHFSFRGLQLPEAVLLLALACFSRRGVAPFEAKRLLFRLFLSCNLGVPPSQLLFFSYSARELRSETLACIQAISSHCCSASFIFSYLNNLEDFGYVCCL